MPKRDYKSYNVLDEELLQEEYGETEGKIQESREKKRELENKIDEQNEVIGELKQVEVNVDAENVKKSEPVVEMNKNRKQDKVILEKRTEKEEEIIKEEIIKKEASKKANNDDHVEDNKEVDMTFSGYKSYQQMKERSRFAKWSIRLMKFILIMMLLPLLAIIGIGIFIFLGGFIGVTAGTAALGFFILGSICFMATQINPALVALGIAVSITAFSLSGILGILFCMLMKWCMSLFKKNKKNDKKINKKEGR